MIESQERLHSRLLGHIPNKRLIVAQLAGALGFLRLLEFLAARKKPAIVVLTYHRIALPNDAAQPYYDPVISATPESFRAQLRLLARHFRLLTLEELLSLQVDAQARAQINKPVALVTFDDGYRDNYETALPILQSHNVPAVFFIPTRFLEDPVLPWWDHVAYVLKTTQVDALCLERFKGDKNPIHIQLGRCAGADERTRAVQAVIAHFVNGTIGDHPWFLDQLNVQGRVAIDTQAIARKLFMGWDEVKELVRAGMPIGSHGHSHQALGKLSDDAQRTELTTSRMLLENGTGKDVHALAYPFGWNLTYSARTQQLAAEAGYRVAFSSSEGVNEVASLHREPMSLRRLNVGTGDSPLLLRARALSYATLGRSAL
jgi:peptidoglycan/xylan/chitin deacetylase (PgdA/CDA1 family)